LITDLLVSVQIPVDGSVRGMIKASRLSTMGVAR
jgi:hypothetical protein